MSSETWKMDALADAVADHRVDTAPALDGLLTGAGVAAGASSPFWLFSLLLAVESPEAVFIAVFGVIIGIVAATLLGVGFGVLDAPGRIAVALARRESPLALLLMCQATGLLLGGVWIGLAGAIGGAAAGVLGGMVFGELGQATLVMAILGWFAGLFLGAPAMLMHATARGLSVNFRSPRLVSAFVATASAFGVVLFLATLYAGLAAVVMLVSVAV